MYRETSEGYSVRTNPSYIPACNLSQTSAATIGRTTLMVAQVGFIPEENIVMKPDTKIIGLRVIAVSTPSSSVHVGGAAAVLFTHVLPFHELEMFKGANERPSLGGGRSPLDITVLRVAAWLVDVFEAHAKGIG